MSSQKGSVEVDDGSANLHGAKEFAEDNRLAPAQVMSEEEFLDAEKKLKKKLDTRLLACVWLIFVMNYLDRVSAATIIHALTD
jgi:hypothetical protein